MSPMIFWMSAAVLVLPPVLFYAGSKVSGLLGVAPAVFVLAIYVFIWLYMRPSHFELSPTSLDVVWPIRRFSTALFDIQSIELLEGSEFRNRYGYGMRIGAGGLWGGFGLLKTRSETFRFYISRLDRYVLIRTASAPPLLITPTDPEDFVRTLELLRAGGQP